MPSAPRLEFIISQLGNCRCLHLHRHQLDSPYQLIEILDVESQPGEASHDAGNSRLGCLVITGVYKQIYSLRMLFYFGHGRIHVPHQRQCLFCGLFVRMLRKLGAKPVHLLAEFVSLGLYMVLRLGVALSY